MENRLLVVGDSFSADNLDTKDTYKAWYVQTAEKLGLKCDNHSLIGSSQDWCWWKLAQNISSLTPQDQILVVITHPGRFWFFDNKPQLTNYQILNIDDELNQEQLDAVKKYIMHVQRPPLDIQLQAHRLGWLDAQVRRYKLKPAHVICAFPIFVQEQYQFKEHVNWLDYENVIVSKGDLISIERREYKQGVDENELWQGYDCRYNHLIKDNHAVLANIIAEAIQNGTNADITQYDKFVSDCIDLSVFDDKEFCDKQFDKFVLEERNRFLSANSEQEKPWAVRSGLMDFWKNRKG